MTSTNHSPGLTPRLTSARARSIAECKWGRGGTNVCKTNAKHAYYFSCSGHGGYIVDGAILTAKQRAQIDQHIKPDMVRVVVRGDIVDFMENPYSNRRQTYRSRDGQEIVSHPVYLFEEDCDWSVLEKFTPIRLIDQYPDAALHEEHIQECFDRWHGTSPVDDMQGSAGKEAVAPVGP